MVLIRVVKHDALDQTTVIAMLSNPGVSNMKYWTIPMRFFLVCVFAALSLPPSPLSAAEFSDDHYFGQMEEMRGKLEGEPAIEFSTETWIGDEATLDDNRGKVVVLDFWATWCGPCVASIPKNIELVQSHPDDLVFVGMHSAASGWDKAPQMVEDRDINYPVALDTGETAEAYGISAYPTYIIIDRNGIVRAAGVKPSHVKTIVDLLIEESGPPAGAMKLASFDPDWFYSGSLRMRTWQDQRGQPAQPIRARSRWKLGDEMVDDANENEAAKEAVAKKEEGEDENSEDGEPGNEEIAADAESPNTVSPDADEIESSIGFVRVVHFTRPEMAITKTQLKMLNETAAKYAPQGVDFAVVCDRESDWDAARAFASEIDLGVPMVLDADVQTKTGKDESDPDDADPTQEPTENEPVENEPVENGADYNETESTPRESGQTASSYHVRIAPVTVVIDRDGRIRATGLKLDQLSVALDLLLSERANE